MSDDIDIRPATAPGRTAPDEYDDRDTPDGRDDAFETALEHITVENDDAPDECAIFPRDATERELTTTWITAQEESFVDLESIR